MNKWICVIFIVINLSFAQESRAERNIAIPFEEKFDSGDTWTSDLLRAVNGATGTHLVSGGWSGGCAKFTPPNTVGGGSNGQYCGLGQFRGLSTGRINIRFLMYLGSTYLSTATETAGGLINKLIIVEPSHDMAGLNADTDLSHFGFGPLNGDGSYVYNDIYGDYRDYAVPYARTKIGDGGAYIGEWLSVEYELDDATNTTTTWLYDSGGLIDTITDTNDPGMNTTYVDVIGGYYNRIHTNQDANTYLLIDELKISNTYIGPPPGFGEAVASSPTLRGGIIGRIQ